MMPDLFEAGRFLVEMGRHPQAPTTEAPLAGLRCWRITPPDRAPRGTVLAVHGASPMGPLDPRWMQIGFALARAGFLALAPMIPSACRLRLDAEQPEQIAALIDAAAAAPALCPDGRVSVLSVSFSGGLAFAAAARAQTTPQAILTIGAYGDSRGTLRSLLRDPEADWYGLLVGIAHFFGHSAGRPALGDAILAVAEDDYHDHPPTPAQYRRWLDAEDAELFDQLLFSLPDRVRLMEEVLQRPDPLFDILDGLAVQDRIPCPVTLIHGAGDKVIPPSESVTIAARRRAAGLPVRLVVTPLLEHSATDLSPWSLARHAPPLVWALSRWMAEAATR